jgi:hypothetical protein
MVFTIANQVGFSVLVSNTPVLHFLLGEFRGVIFEFCNFCNTDYVLRLRIFTVFFNIIFAQFLLKKKC